jgi:hypothetical protein
VAALDTLIDGLPRGALTEVCGHASSGRTSLLLAMLAAATSRGETCALVDVSDALDPQSAAAGGVILPRLLWIRCGETGNSRAHSIGNIEKALRAIDLLLQSGGFGLVAVDMGDIPPRVAGSIPLTSWFRFRRAIEPTPTVLLVADQQPCTGACASLVIRLTAGPKPAAREYPEPTHAQLLDETEIEVELLRRTTRKPTGAVTASFRSPAAWV